MIGSSQGIRVFTRDKEDIAPDAAIQIILGHVRYIPHEPLICKSLNMLTVEQFQNPKLNALQTK